MTADEPHVSLRSLFACFFGIGASSFGGGITGWIHRKIVHERRWIKDDDMLAGIALSQIVPGANVTNTCVYVGHRLRGVAGALTALIGLLCVPFVATVLVYLAWDTISAYPAMQDLVDGVAAAAVGLNLRLGVVGAKRCFPKILPLLVLLATFLSVGVWQLPIIPVMAVLAPIGIAVAWPRKPADA